MNSEPFPPIPSDTASAARAVFGKDNFYLVIGDQANSLFSGLILKDHNGPSRKPTGVPAILYLVTIFQFLETLPDNLVEDALRKRVDWKYALHLPLNFLDLEASRLCGFRKFVLADLESEQNLQVILSRLSDINILTGKQNLNQKTTYVIKRVCLSSRLAKVVLTMNTVLGALAIKQPEWLRRISRPHWYESYSQNQKALRMAYESPKPETFAQRIGYDGFYLLEMIRQSDRQGLADLPEVITLEKVWREQYEQAEATVLWRTAACEGCSLSDIFEHSL